MQDMPEACPYAVIGFLSQKFLLTFETVRTHLRNIYKKLHGSSPRKAGLTHGSGADVPAEVNRYLNKCSNDEILMVT